MIFWSKLAKIVLIFDFSWKNLFVLKCIPGVELPNYTYTFVPPPIRDRSYILRNHWGGLQMITLYVVVPNTTTVKVITEGGG